jgi:DNA-binding GntR family transcriptional regulator
MTTAVDTRHNVHASITDELRAAIRNGQFLPNQRLVEVELAQLFNTNRVNVRTALAVLEQEGLVVREVNRGARVRLVTEDEAIEIAEARAALEVRVAYLAAHNVTDADRARLRNIIARMVAAHKKGDLLAFSGINGELHEEIQRVAANRTISKLLSGLKSQTVRLQYRAILLPGRASASLAEHKAIVDAVVDGKPQAAERAMRKHLNNVVESLKQAIAAQKHGLL